MSETLIKSYKSKVLAIVIPAVAITFISAVWLIHNIMTKNEVGSALQEELGHYEVYGNKLTEKQAVEIGQMLIRRRLKVPSTARFDGNNSAIIRDNVGGGSTDYLVGGKVVSQDTKDSPFFRKSWVIILTTKVAAAPSVPEKNLDVLFKWYLTYGYEWVSDGEYNADKSTNWAVYWEHAHPNDFNGK